MNYWWGMSVVLAVCLLFVAATEAIGQLSRLKGTWINPAMQAIIISDTAGEMNTNYLSTGTRTDNLLLRLYRDTLSFQQHYLSSATDNKQVHIDRYDLKIVRHDERTLELKPVSNLAVRYFSGTAPVTFQRQELTTDKTIRFEKLTFSSGLCYGSCPDYTYELTSRRVLRLHVKRVFTGGGDNFEDATARGYFVGQVPDRLYTDVIKALQTCYLRQLTVKSVRCCDAPLQTLTVYFNGQKKSFETMFPPLIMQKLINALHNVYAESPRTRAKSPFEPGKPVKK